MATAVLVPPLGQTVDSVTLVAWHKREGESVQQGEMLFAIETDKATLDIEAPATGVLREVTAGPGDEVQVLSPIAVLVAPGEAVESKRPDRGRETTAPVPVPEAPKRPPRPVVEWPERDGDYRGPGERRQEVFERPIAEEHEEKGQAGAGQLQARVEAGRRRGAGRGRVRHRRGAAAVIAERPRRPVVRPSPPARTPTPPAWSGRRCSRSPSPGRAPRPPPRPCR